VGQRGVEISKRLLALRPLEELIAELHANRAIEVLRILVGRALARLQRPADLGVILARKRDRQRAVERLLHLVVIEDVVTTGRSTREVIDILEGLGAAVIGVASMINRSGMAQPFAPLPSRSLLEVDFPTWTADECPLCGDGVPIAKPGSRPIT